MKTKSIVYCFILAAGFLGAQTASAVDTPTSSQELTLTVNGSALLRVTGLPVTLSLGGATEAGAEIRPSTFSDSTRLKISSLASGTEARKITAQVTSGGSVNKQTVLSIKLLAPTASSAAAFVNYSEQGAPNPALQILSDNASNKAAFTLVTGITTCWSGTATDDGYQIYYQYESVVGKTPTSSATTTVVFTIVAA